MKKHIPNAITSMNLAAGCVGIWLVLNQQLPLWGAACIAIAALFDFFDGFAARLLGVASPIGKELDSLADMVSFGVLPGTLMYYLLDAALGVKHPMLAGAALLIPVFSALRLAKFNVDTRQSYSFIGLPTPANALLIGSLPFIVDEIGGLSAFFAHPLVLIGITVVFSLLLVSEVPLLAMKFQNYSWASNQTRYTFLIISVVLLVLLQVKAIPFIIVIYIALSVFDARSFVYREPKEEK